MDENTLNYLTHKVTNALMRFHGFDRKNSLHKLEFDHTSPDSHYSMAFADADVAVRTAIDSLMSLDAESIPEAQEVATTAPDSVVDTGEPTPEDEYKSKELVSIINSSYIFCQAKSEESVYMSDVKKWVEQMELAGATDDTEVEADLVGEVFKEAHSLERTTCMNCDSDDLLVNYHDPYHEKTTPEPYDI